MLEQHVRLIHRLKNTEDGKDFIEYLQQLSLDNYKAWKRDGGDILRGKAIALDELILLFDTIEEKSNYVAQNPEWM